MNDHWNHDGGLRPYVWALAGALPATVIAAVVADSRAGFVLLAVAVAWQHIASSRAERAAQSPKVRLLERRIRLLELDVLDAQRKAREATAETVVDLREGNTLARWPGKQQAEIRRRLDEAKRVAAEPTPAEIAQAKADMVAAFEPYDTWGDPR